MAVAYTPGAAVIARTGSGSAVVPRVPWPQRCTSAPHPATPRAAGGDAPQQSQQHTKVQAQQGPRTTRRPPRSGWRGSGVARPAAAAARSQRRAAREHSQHTAAIAEANVAARSAQAAALDAEPVHSFSDLFGTSGESNQGSQPGTRAAAGGSVDVHISIVCKVSYGQSLRLVGSPPGLGAWDVVAGRNMVWHEGHRWDVHVPMAPGSEFEFKFVLVRRSGVCEWEPGTNRRVMVPESAGELQVRGAWGATETTEALELRAQPDWAAALRTQQQQQQQQQPTPIESVDEAIPVEDLAAEAAEPITTFADAQPMSPLAEAGHVLGAQAAEQQEQQPSVVSPQLHEQQLLVPEPVASAAPVAAEPRALSAHEAQEMVAEVLDMRAALSGSLTDMGEAVREVQHDLVGVQQDLARLTTERILQAQQDGVLQGSLEAALLAGLDAGGEEDESIGDWLPDAELDDPEGADDWDLLWATVAARQGEQPGARLGAALAAAGAAPVVTSAPPAQLANMATVNGGALMAAAPPPLVPRGMSGSSGEQRLPLGPFLSSSMSDAALTGLQGAVASWRQELGAFRQEGTLLQHELAELTHGMDSLERQLLDNAAALEPDDQDKQALAQPQGYDGSGSWAGGGGAGGAGVNVGDSVLQRELIARLDQLASDLRTEVTQAVRVASASQQMQQAMTAAAAATAATAAEPLPADGVGMGGLLDQLWERTPPNAVTHQLERQLAAAPRRAPVEDVAAAAVALRLMGRPRSAQQHQRGLLCALMMAAGVWEPGLMTQLKGTPLRLTWRAYRATWGDEHAAAWRGTLTTPTAAIAAVRAGGRDGARLATHALWSMRELAVHSPAVSQLLRTACSAADAALLRELAPGSAAQQAAAADMLCRWLADTEELARSG